MDAADIAAGDKCFWSDLTYEPGTSALERKRTGSHAGGVSGVLDIGI